jgi:hypothetical protein
MEIKQSLQVIKEILDAASKSGLFHNLESSILAANAYQTIESHINKPVAIPTLEN